jgi:hypothetical protein
MFEAALLKILVFSWNTYFFDMVFDNPTTGAAIGVSPLVRIVSYGVRLSLYR